MRTTRLLPSNLRPFGRCFVLFVFVYALCGCGLLKTYETPEVPYTYTRYGDGSKQDLARDFYECAKESMLESSPISGDVVGTYGEISGRSDQRISCGLWNACVVAKGWVREKDRKPDMLEVSIQDTLQCYRYTNICLEGQIRRGILVVC
jgi:hypothetical protein